MPQPYVICHKIYAKSHICSFYLKNPLGVKESLLMSKVLKCIKQIGWEVDQQQMGEYWNRTEYDTDVPVLTRHQQSSHIHLIESVGLDER